MPQSPHPNLLKSSDQITKFQHLRKLSNLWDRAIQVPGTNLRLGLESLIGLLPVGGDVVGIILSGYILIQAFQFGLPKTILLRMLFNIALDGAVGSIPILGDLFDTTWKANTKNVNLLEEHLRSPADGRRASSLFLFLLLLGLLLVALMLVAITILVLKLLSNLSKF